MPVDWLDNKHPIWTENEDAWERDERRYFGGDVVLEELRRFDWESTPQDVRDTDHYTYRQAQAVYVNFPELFTRQMVGHLFSKGPQPDAGLSFGTLGEVREDREGSPTRAELVYFNTDGVGNNGSQWDNFWAQAMRHAMVTGHRWIMVESPTEKPVTQQDEIDGLRPYLVEFSPLSVVNWHTIQGKLAFAVIKISERNPRIEKGKMEGNDPEDNYLLLVMEGFVGLGEDYAGGGWWRFDSDMNPIEDETGTWESTNGEIPLFPLYYERAERNSVVETMSRAGTVELGQAAVSYMNLSSAADYDAWDAAQSVQYLTGVDKDGWDLALQAQRNGSKMVPLPPNKRTGTAPSVVDGSTGAVVAEVFEKRLERKRMEAEELAALEASSTPDSSGLSKRAGFADLKAPRLALMASEIEQAQNTAIKFLELRFAGSGTQTEGETVWPREFELLPLVDAVREIFELMTMTDSHSQSLVSKGITEATRQKGLITEEDELEIVRAELEISAETGSTEANRLAAEEAALTAALNNLAPEGEPQAIEGGFAVA